VNDTADVRREHLRKAMAGTSARLQANLGASSPLKDSLTKGELREQDVVAAFRPHIPMRYDVVKGVVVNAAGEESDPQDVVLLDSMTAAPIFGDDQTKIVPVEGVTGVIQVKSVATPSSLRSAVKNVASAKAVLPQGERIGLPSGGLAHAAFQSTSATFFGGVLCLSRRGKTQSLIDAYAEAVMEVEPRERCDALCLVDAATVLWGNPSKSLSLHFTLRGEQASAPLWLSSEQDSLLLFYMSLVEHLRNWIAPKINWVEYVFGRGGSGNPLSFTYSYWYDETNPPDWVNGWDPKT
jgi:hypothetical protein